MDFTEFMKKQRKEKQQQQSWAEQKRKEREATRKQLEEAAKLREEKSRKEFRDKYVVSNSVEQYAKETTRHTVSRNDRTTYTRENPKQESVLKEKPIRIKHIKTENMDSKLKMNIVNLKRAYPQVMAETMLFQDLIEKVLPSKIKQRVTVRNESFTNNRGGITRRVGIYNNHSSYLSKRLPADTYLFLEGRLVNGELVIDELRICEKPIIKTDDIVTDVVFYYDGPNHENWLYDVTAEAAESVQRLTGEIASWNDYLDWKRKLAELRIRGLKYIGFSLDIDNREMTFLVVSEGKKGLDDFKKYLRRNEISAFSNNYSNSRWYFEFNRDYQDYYNNDSGVPLSFLRLGRSFIANDVEEELWDRTRYYSKRYENAELLTSKSLLSEITRYYAEPYISEVVFELSNNAMENINRQIIRNGEVSEDIEEILSEEFYSDGYIATSQIGDFALIHRLKLGVNDLIMGKAASHGLDEWLFDISKARIPENVSPITYWQNQDINEKQKEAVEKILSAPDVCLIQGPPGTGKTTVIAEAIYQCVIRNKRVMVASQANLAVDNALERLITNPKVRAIRLGSSKKIDSSVSNITEQNVLESFYKSIIEYLDRRYLQKWDQLDYGIQEGYGDISTIRTVSEEIDKAKDKVQVMKMEITNLSISQEEYSVQSGLRLEKINLVLLKNYCQGNNHELELMLNKDNVIEIWNAIVANLISLQNLGLWLTRVPVDIDSLNDSYRLQRANDNIKFILLNVRTAIQLYKKMKSTKEFGGESTELEELKIRQQLLLNKLQTSPTPDVIEELQSVLQKITEFSNTGSSLSETESRLFDAIELQKCEENKKQEHVLGILEKALPVLRLINESVIEKTQQLMEEITEKQEKFKKRSDNQERRKEELERKIEDIQQSVNQYLEKKANVLRKYDGDNENIEVKIEEQMDALRQQYSTDIERNEWEEIFRDLENWVTDIPDYAQERDIYLKDFINGCNVVGVSCTENARTLTENGFHDFDVVIIDEVSKATPPELLIPMLRGRKIVLVGDHRQLPPLFNEHEKTYQEIAEQQEEAAEEFEEQLTMNDFHKYKTMVTSSLFERYFENADDRIRATLDCQYRMHTDIMDIVNIFYDDNLKDGNDGFYTVDKKAHYLSIPSTAGTEMIIPERHAYWFDSSELLGEKIYEQRRQGSSSAENIVEAGMIIELLRKMEIQYANRRRRNRMIQVGIISFYYDQVALIRRLLREETFHVLDIEVNTVDRFQGKEKEIVFVSMVRNLPKYRHKINSHIAAFQRINVAFSRAQNLLLIVGAKDMYVDQPVKMTDMKTGAEKIVMAYKKIIEMLDYKGTFFTANEIIPDVRAEEILREYLKSQGGNE